MSAAKKIAHSPRAVPSHAIPEESGIVLVGARDRERMAGRLTASDEIDLVAHGAGVTTTDALATRMGGALVFTAFFIAVVDALR